MSSTPDPKYCLIIPAYNEERRIVSFFDTTNGFEGELIVVCDGTDATAEVVEQIAHQRNDLVIRCLRFKERLGKGGGIIAGLAVARAPLVGYVDADGSTSIDELTRLFSLLGPYDGVFGSRWVLGSKLQVQQGLLRQLESRGFNLFIRILFGLRYRDTQCGAKVFKKASIDLILPKMISRGFEFDVELLWRLSEAGFKIGEFPIEWQNIGDSRVKWRDIIRMLTGLIRIRLHADSP